MDIAIIACISRDGALNGFAPSRLDRSFFKAMTTSPAHAQFWRLTEKSFTEQANIPLDTLFKMAIEYHQRISIEMNAVLIGRKTWEDPSPWGVNRRGLEDRETLVLTSKGASVTYGTIAATMESFDMALAECITHEIPNLWIAGGAQVYNEALTHPAVRMAYITEIDEESQGATASFPWKPCPAYDFDDERYSLGKNKAGNTEWFIRTAATPWLDENGRRMRFTKWEKA